MHINNIVVGAGFAGSVLARRIAEEKGEEVWVVEKQGHIAGNAYDHYDSHGILVHRYGPHIFHTQCKAVWDWLSRFTSWYYYQHRVLAYVEGRLIPLPISVETINRLYNLNLSCEEMGTWLAAHAEPAAEIRTSADVIVSQAGRNLYERLFKNYSFKQWGRYPEELDPSVFNRLPIRESRDTRYFTDVYQGMPACGYTVMFSNILDHEKIRLVLNTNWYDLKDRLSWDRLFFTGPIDGYYGYAYGRLGYRSIRLEWETFPTAELYQQVGVVNYPNDYDFTRITEYRHLTGQMAPCTTISREYPCEEGEPYYVTPTEENRGRYEKYRQLAQSERKVLFVGRLAEYRYYNMDQVVERALGIDLPL